MQIKHPSLPFIIDTDTQLIWIPKRRTAAAGWYPGSSRYKKFTYEGRVYFVHRLIAETCIPNPDKLPIVDHINRDPTDNRVENLRWVSVSENRYNCDSIISQKERFGVSRRENKELYDKLYKQFYLDTNKEEIRERRKEQSKKNATAIKKRNRVYYVKNRERILKKAKERNARR